MKNLKSIEEFLNEGKQVGVAYHYTSMSNLIQILDSNSLRGVYSTTTTFSIF